MKKTTARRLCALLVVCLCAGAAPGGQASLWDALTDADTVSFLWDALTDADTLSSLWDWDEPEQTGASPSLWSDTGDQGEARATKAEEEAPADHYAGGGQPYVFSPSSYESPARGYNAFQTHSNRLKSFDILQVLAKGFDAATGQFYDMYNLAAGKKTTLFVAFAEKLAVPPNTFFRVIRDGRHVYDLYYPDTSTREWITCWPLDLSVVDHWKAGHYTFEFYFGGELWASRDAAFTRTKDLKILAVPLIGNYGGGDIRYPSDRWKFAGEFARATYPVSHDGYTYVLGGTLDLSARKYDLTSDDGMYNVWAAVAALQPPGKDYDLIVGFFQDILPGGILGYTIELPATIATMGGGDMEATVAHEIAHCYLIGDEYPGGHMNQHTNPAPFKMEGVNIQTYRDDSGPFPTVVSMQDWGYDECGSVIYPEQVPYNTLQNVRYNDGSSSYMGWGVGGMDNLWVTSDIWNHIFNCLKEGRTSGGSSAGSYQSDEEDDWDWDWDWVWDLLLGRPAMRQRAAASVPSRPASHRLWQAWRQNRALERETVRVIDITGRLYKDGRFLEEPWFAYDANPRDIALSKQGEYAVVMRDSAGKTVMLSAFDGSFFLNANPPQEMDYFAVSQTLPLPEDTRTISIQQGQTTLYERQLSAHAPEVEFVGIEEYQRFAGKQEIRWTASDADGDELWYELWYSPDGEEFIHIATNLRETACAVDFDELPGSEEAYLYLYATDGGRTGECDSPYISVEYKAPDIMTGLDGVPEYAITDEIRIEIYVYDTQDGWLSDTDLAWTYKDRHYMYGDALYLYPYEMTPGAHTMTLTATNSAGVSSSRDYTFAILDDESALPDDWSREDVKAALSDGYVAPLANVTAPMSRRQYAKLLETLYWSMWEEGAPDPEYREGVVTDGGIDDYREFLMVELGVMEAPEGEFRPNGQVTQEEAARMMYTLCSIADPEWFPPTGDIAEMVAFFQAYEVMDERPENAYAPEANITGQLALVRCGRLMRAVFEE